MWIPDMPDVPPQNIPVLIAQANQPQINKPKLRTIGICAPAPSHSYSLENVSSPVADVNYYLRQYEKQNITGPATVTILQQPKHGVLRLVTEMDRGSLFSSESGQLDPADPGYAYLPESGYEGKDSATLLVDFSSVKVTVKYFFRAINRPVGDNWKEEYCIRTGVYWKISSILDANGNTTINSVAYQPADGNSTVIGPASAIRFKAFS